MGEFLLGLLVGLMLGAGIIGIVWNESVKDENDQIIKKK